MSVSAFSQLPAFEATLFDRGRIDSETQRLNAAIIDLLKTAPDQWSFPAPEVRAMRAQGKGPFPKPALSTRARMIEIAGTGGVIPLRIIEPRQKAKGIFLHIHGGGWTFGTADSQDARLERLADNLDLAVISVEYRLAPENPYPAAPDDCERVALWLVSEGAALFKVDKLFIGGESAGAHLSVVTMLRLRDKHRISPFKASLLTAGCYDLGLTPSARQWGEEKLVLNTRDLEKFVESYLGGGKPGNHDISHPDISPLYADLKGLPPAHFLVGTRDPLVDDTLFMYGRWTAAENQAELAVWPGGAHVFIAFPGALAHKALMRAEAFIKMFL